MLVDYNLFTLRLQRVSQLYTWHARAVGTTQQQKHVRLYTITYFYNQRYIEEKNP